jgi:hypothetical protein
MRVRSDDRGITTAVGSGTAPTSASAHTVRTASASPASRADRSMATVVPTALTYTMAVILAV